MSAAFTSDAFPEFLRPIHWGCQKLPIPRAFARTVRLAIIVCFIFNV